MNEKHNENLLKDRPYSKLCLNHGKTRQQVA